MLTRAIASDLARPGLVIAGRYRLESILGQGGMGSVWAATHLGLGSQVAIKLVSRELLRAPEALRRFDAEAKAVAKLPSRHVVQIYDNGTLDDGTPYIAMELLRGESLHARVHKSGPLPLAESVQILAQCCKALGRAHAAGIVHRDVKPDNIFLALSSDEDGYVVKVLDFGIAKVAQGEGDVHSSTQTGALLGTPLYMSPEQARGLKTLDQRTDLYSLGLVSYTMLTGNLAFSGESFGDLLLQIFTQPLPSLRASAAWLPEAMDPWFQYVCAREPAQRCPTAHDFIESLRIAAGVALPSDSGVGARAMARPSAAPMAAPAPPTGGTDLSMHGTAPGRARRRGAWIALGVSTTAALLVGTLLFVGRRPQMPAAATPAELAHPSAAPVPPPSATPPVAREPLAHDIDAGLAAAATAVLRVDSLPVLPRAARTAPHAPPQSAPDAPTPSAATAVRPRSSQTDDINLGY